VAVAKTVISVAIIGNAKGLIGTLNQADAKMGGFLKGAAKGFIAFAAVDKAFDAVGSLVENADRAGDAMGRLASNVGDVNVAKLDAIAGNFADIGVSRPDFLEIVAGFSEFATASGKIDPGQITSMAGGVAQFAGAMGALKGVDPATLGDDIANFISGTRGAQAAGKELGVMFDPSMTSIERYNILMQKLPGLLNDVTGANAGLDDKQNELNAKWETFGSEVGPVVEGSLSNILGFILDEIDAIPGAIQGWQMLGDAIKNMAAEVLTPLARVADALNAIGMGLSDPSIGNQIFGNQRPNTSLHRNETNTNRDVQDRNNRNGVVNQRIGGLGS
jgi:phage-related minor tail protein